MYYKKNTLPKRLDEALDDSEFEEPSVYDLDQFDAKNGVMVKSLAGIDGVNLEGFLDMNPVFSIDNELNKVVEEVDSMVGSKLRSFGSGALFYKNGVLAIVVFIEDWNEGCIPREKIEARMEGDYAEKSSKEIVEEADQKLPEGEWSSFAEGYNPHYGGMYGQTAYMKVNWDA